MSELAVDRPIRRAPTHPGTLMREILDDHLHMPIATAATRMGVSRQSLYAALKGDSAVTADMALRFAKLVKAAPELYLHMQTTRDLWVAQDRLRETLDAIEPAA